MLISLVLTIELYCWGGGCWSMFILQDQWSTYICISPNIQSMFDTALQDRLQSFQSAPGTSMFLHWLVGMVYVFYFASFILLLREVRQSVIPQAIWVIPQAIWVIPQSIRVIPPAVWVIPPAISVIPQAISVIPQAMSIIPQAISVIPQVISVIPHKQ